MARFFLIPLLLLVSGVLFLFSVVMFFSGIWGLIGSFTGIADVYGWGFGIALGLPTAVISWGSLWIAWVMFRDERLLPKEKRAQFLTVYIIIFLAACLIPVLGLPMGAKKHKKQNSGNSAQGTVITLNGQKIKYT